MPLFGSSTPLVLLALLSACDHQYIAIPGARAIDEGTSKPAATTQRPTVTITEGTPSLTLGGHVRMRVDFSAMTEMKVSELIFMAKGPYGDWVLDLTEAEMAAGYAEVEVHALKDSPDSKWCQPDERGNGSCSQQADDGVSFFGLGTRNASSSGGGAEVPIRLAALASGQDDTCAGFTAKECCTGSTGISVVACYVAEVCGCPSPTTKSGGVRADGTVMCMCP